VSEEGALGGGVVGVFGAAISETAVGGWGCEGSAGFKGGGLRY
jgi:hypothetical protein